MNYPKRGTKSEDGKLYTHTDGSVHESVPFEGNCRHCSCWDFCDTQCHIDTMFRRIAGAFVMTDEVLEACEAMREQIPLCGEDVMCNDGCVKYWDRSCPIRAYLAKHGQPDAWEVRP